MELKHFIAQALTNIVTGVEEANKEVNRFMLASQAHTTRGSGQDVEFDVSVTVSKSSEIDGGGKIGMAMISAGASASKSDSNENISRIKFKVFIAESENKLHSLKSPCPSATGS